MSQVQSAAQTKNAKRLNRDQRLKVSPFFMVNKYLGEHVQIKTLNDSGMNQTSIAKELGISRNQVRYTLCTPYIEPKKATGRPPTLSSSDVARIEAFITSSSEGRRISWFELAHGPFRDLGVSERVIQNELKKRGYVRHPALKKPPLSEEVKRKRREWAEAPQGLDCWRLDGDSLDWWDLGHRRPT